MFGGGGGDSPFSDFFTTFFGGMGGQESTGARGGRARPRHRKGQDVEHPFELDLEDAIRGSVQRLQLRHDGQARTRRSADSRRRDRRLARARRRRRRPRRRQRRRAATCICA